MTPERKRLCAAAPACVTAVALAGSGLRAQASPSPITFNSGAWQVSIGGYFKLSLIHDFNAITSPDVFDPRSIPVDGSKGTNTRITARETRLSLGIKGPVEGRDLELFLEGDFFGPGTGTGHALRLRHAYARYGALLAGQTWTTFMDERNIPPTIDFEHALAAPTGPTRPSARDDRTLEAQRSGLCGRGERPGGPDPSWRPGSAREDVARLYHPVSIHRQPRAHPAVGVRWADHVSELPPEPRTT